MRMKKRIVSLALAAAIMISASVPALATGNFDKSVFNGRDDVNVSYDDMTAITKVYSQAQISGSTQSSINFGERGIIMVLPYIGIMDTSYDSLDVFTLQFDFFGHNWINLNEIIIKVGDNRYDFLNCYTSQSTDFNGLAHEVINFNLKNEVLPFIQDFVKHPDAEIKVRLCGDNDSFDFVLTDDMKNDVILLYNIFVKGNGTRKSNMDNISQIDQTTVMRNNIQL